jgi:hypothetical protein
MNKTIYKVRSKQTGWHQSFKTLAEAKAYRIAEAIKYNDESYIIEKITTELVKVGKVKMPEVPMPFELPVFPSIRK